MLEDIALGKTQEINKSDAAFIIDLAGKNIAATDARALWVKSGDVSIVDSSPGGNKGTVSAEKGTGKDFKNSSSVIRVGDGNDNNGKAKLTIGEGVTVSSGYCYGVSVFGKNDTDNNKETADIEFVVEGTIAVTGAEAAISGNGTNELSATKMTIGANANVTSKNNYAIYHPGKGDLVVKGNVKGDGGIEAKSGDVEVADGAKVKATATDQTRSTNNNGPSTSGYAIAAVSNDAYVGAPTVTIAGGIVEGKAITLADGTAENKGIVTATSNSISIDPGYRWVAIGTDPETYKLEEVVYIAKIGEQGYESFAEAMEQVDDGATITLLKNIALGATQYINKSDVAFIIDLAGKNITATDARALCG